MSEMFSIRPGNLSRNEVNAGSIELARSRSRHLTSDGEVAPLQEGQRSFGEMMVFDTLKKVSDAENKVSHLSQLAAIDPASVSSEDVTIAMAQADLSLGITKAVFDRGIRAYQEILSFR